METIFLVIKYYVAFCFCLHVFMVGSIFVLKKLKFEHVGTSCGDTFTFTDAWQLWILSFFPVINLAMIGMLGWETVKDPEFKPFCQNIWHGFKRLFS